MAVFVVLSFLSGGLKENQATQHAMWDDHASFAETPNFARSHRFKLLCLKWSWARWYTQGRVNKKEGIEHSCGKFMEVPLDRPKSSYWKHVVQLWKIKTCVYMAYMYIYMYMNMCMQKNIYIYKYTHYFTSVCVDSCTQKCTEINGLEGELPYCAIGSATTVETWTLWLTPTESIQIII